MHTTAIFDMDGLLLDSERPIRDAWEAVLAELGFAYDHALYLSAIGRNLADTRVLLSQGVGPGFDFDEALARVRARLAPTLEREGFALKPGVVALLAELSTRGVAKGVASSTARERVEQRLRQAGLAAHFTSLACGDEVRRGKPEPDIFLLAASRLGVAPETCLVFEDSSYGARGALAAGMGVVLVPDLKPPDADVQDRALGVLGSLQEAMERLDQWFCVN